MSCQDALYVAGIALLASSIASFAAAAWAYRALDIRGAKADLAGTRAGGGGMPGRIPVPRRVRLCGLAAPLPTSPLRWPLRMRRPRRWPGSGLPDSS